MIKSLKLRRDIDSLPVYFSQVREDPSLDVQAIKTIGRSCKVLMIASGGDTICRLATLHEVTSIDAIDANSSQISLSKFKLSLLKFSPENRLRILGHETMDTEIRRQIVEEICRELKIQLTDFGPRDLSAEVGLDFTGRYEQLFSGIQKELQLRGKRISDLHFDSSVLDEVFNDYFDLDLLVKIFGKAATQNPLQTFSDHFLYQTQNYLKSPAGLHSPYLCQMLSGQFSQEAYDWMKQPALKDSEIKPVVFHQSMMLDYLIHAEDCAYDFIHLSNILDWLSEEEGSFLLRQAHRVLRRGGKVIIRQLNSSLNIKSLEEGFKWDTALSESLRDKDRSFFYREILVGEKAL